MKPPKHPAPFADVFLDFVRAQMDAHAPLTLTLVDPMAGTCKIHQLQGHHVGTDKHDDYDVWTVAGELEPEWTQPSPDPEAGVTVTGVHAFETLLDDEAMERWIVTSPVWGNRMADHHDATDTSERLTYRHKLGRDFTAGSSCALAWGDEYRAWHSTFLRIAYETSKPNERMLIEIGDHLRTVNGQTVRAQVTAWWIREAVVRGWHLDVAQRLEVGRLRQGANYEKRVPYIHGLVFVR